jgi:hypothetical protein
MHIVTMGGPRPPHTPLALGSRARCSRALASLAAVLLSSAVALPALAEDVTAQALREKARAALTAGDTAGACVLFEQTYQAARAPGSAVAPDDALFELADCHEKLGKGMIAGAEFDQLAAGGGPRADAARARAATARNAVPAPPPPPPAPPPLPPAQYEAPMPVVSTLTSGEAPTAFGNFMDTRLAWTFGDDDVLHAVGQVLPISQSFNVGNRPQYRLFFDALDSRFSGRENITHLALYKKMPGFIKRLDTEASAVLRFNFAQLGTDTNSLNSAFYDAGSFIRLFYHTGDDPHGKTGLDLTLWPIDTDRFRLGYLYYNSWGGTGAGLTPTQSIFPRSQGSAPGAKLQYSGENWNLFAGFKTATISQIETIPAPGVNTVQQTSVNQTNVGVLAGGSADFTDFFRLDVNGGYFQQGKFILPDVVGKPVYTGGFSARLVFHDRDMPVPESVDFLLYRNDPDKPQIIFKPEVYVPGKTSWFLSAEYDHLFQNLKDFDVVGATMIQQAHAGAVQAQVKSGFFRASVVGIYQDLPYVLKDQPSFVPFETLPADTKTSPEIFVAAHLDYYFERTHLTPGIDAGVQFPATFTSDEVGSSSAPIDRTVVVRSQGDLGILPVGVGAVPIVELRASLRWEISRILAAMIWIQYKRDNNATLIETDPSTGTADLRAFVSPDFFGMGTSVQARF